MNSSPTPANIDQLPPGTLIRVNCGIYDHVALLGHQSWSDERKVLSFGPQPNGLTEMGFGEFAKGRQVVVDGYPGHLPPHEVLARAREAGCKRRYSWLSFNCEHFVRHAHGLTAESPQLVKACLLGLAAFALLRPVHA